MQANPAFPDGIPAVSSQLQVCLAYQDLPTGLLARRFLSDLLNHSQVGNEFSLSLWNVAMFHLSEIRDEAVLSASKSDLIILSLRGDAALERETENWLTQWIARRTDESALAVLIHHDVQVAEAVGHTLFWLQQITRPTQVRLFLGFMPPAGARPSPPPQQSPLLGSPTFETETFPNPLDVHPEGGLND